MSDHPTNHSHDNRRSPFSFDAGEWRTGTGEGVSVAIVDSGVDASHPDLDGSIASLVEARFDGKRIVFDRSESGDSAGHGTACASLVLKVAPRAKIHSIKVLGAGGMGDGQAFLAGFEYAIKSGCRVINLSLGTTKPQFFSPLHDLLDRAYQAGCIVVAAANNLPQPSFPSVFSSSLVAVSKNDGKDSFKFGFRYGETIELTAPGVNVRTAWLNKGYKNLTGNSFACPHISGIVALLLERFPAMTPFEVKNALFHLADPERSEPRMN